MKIVVNSNKNYSKALRFLFESMVYYGFSRFSDIVVVVSQSDSDSEPHLVPISSLVPFRLGHEVVAISMKMNNFDYTGYHALHLYKDHPLVSDDGYLYMLDTVTVDEDFAAKYESLKPIKNSVFSCHHPHSNICLFGRETIDMYGDNFAVPVTKREAILMEHGQTIVRDGRAVKSISQFGNFVSHEPKVRLRTLDIYKTSHPRTRFRYPMFGLSKWVFLYKSGDMTGKITDN